MTKLSRKHFDTTTEQDFEPTKQEIASSVNIKEDAVNVNSVDSVDDISVGDEKNIKERLNYN